MTITKPPVPVNEMERLLSLSGLDVDFSAHKNSFDDLALLAAKIAGTNISLVNLIDSYTQWTISNHGLDIEQMLREDSACQYTIMKSDYFEVQDLSIDDRFKDKFYVTGEPLARYYLGVPLVMANGIHIGALCVIDQERKTLGPDQVALLKIVASEIVNKLRSFKAMESLRIRVQDAERAKKKVAHDIRGPLAGIIGLSQIIEGQGVENEIEEVLELVSLIQQSGSSLIDLTSEILGNGSGVIENEMAAYEFNLAILKNKLSTLYGAQARQKNIMLSINTTPEMESVPIRGDKLLQITGNLISNALKFTPAYGFVSVDLSLSGRILRIVVTDSGTGLSEHSILNILSGNSLTTSGTEGEQGFGFGLVFVKQLVDHAYGTLEIQSPVDGGAIFTVILPQ